MQWHPFADVADRIGCRLWLLCREAPLGANHSGRSHGAHRCGEHALRVVGAVRYLLLGRNMRKVFFHFFQAGSFLFLRRLHDIRALDADSFGSIE